MPKDDFCNQNLEDMESLMISAKIPVRRDYMSVLGGSRPVQGCCQAAASDCLLEPGLLLEPGSVRTTINAGQQLGAKLGSSKPSPA